MCGRFDRHSELDAFAELIEGLVLDSDPGLPPSYNIAPSQSALVVALGADGAPQAKALEWGLLPGWVSKPGMNRPINARLESVAEKPMFRNAFKKRRCVVLCDGYYEWQGKGSGKQPYYFCAEENRPFVLAGLWESNSRLTEQRVQSFCVVTRSANDAVSEVHHRMPLVPDYGYVQDWLNPNTAPEALLERGSSMSISDLKFYPVSTYVNRPSNNGPECAQALT